MERWGWWGGEGASWVDGGGKSMRGSRGGELWVLCLMLEKRTSGLGAGCDCFDWNVLTAAILDG